MDEQAGTLIALGYAGHEESLELSFEQAGLPGVHQFVEACECRPGISGRDELGDTLNKRLDLVVAG